jgi:hypothetical protein
MLPFIAGIATGAALVVAYGKKKEIKEGVEIGASKVKEFAGDVKESIEGKIDALKSSKEKPQAKDTPEDTQTKDADDDK